MKKPKFLLKVDKGEKMIANIQQGDCIKCIDCGKEFNVNIEFDWDFEYIKCPHCGKSHDIQLYHLYSIKRALSE